jgi:hypothetical protein
VQLDLATQRVGGEAKDVVGPASTTLGTTPTRPMGSKSSLDIPAIAETIPGYDASA